MIDVMERRIGGNSSIRGCGRARYGDMELD